MVWVTSQQTKGRSYDDRYHGTDLQSLEKWHQSGLLTPFVCQEMLYLLDFCPENAEAVFIDVQ